MGAQEARHFKLFSDFWILEFSVIIDMVLKRAKCDLNGVKNRYFCRKVAKKSPSSWWLCPSVTRLSCVGLFSTGPKLDNFCAKYIYF